MDDMLEYIEQDARERFEQNSDYMKRLVKGEPLFDQAISQPVNLGHDRKIPNRLVYLGNEPRPYGINEQDTWGMDHYLAAVMANGLRMLIAYGNAVRNIEEYELIASKLEFYALDYDPALHDNIDWSHDKEEDDLLEWVNADDQSAWPGMNEYSDKSSQIEYWQRQYMSEALSWLKIHWGQLWD